jgi:hypothetical protein
MRSTALKITSVLVVVALIGAGGWYLLAEDAIESADMFKGGVPGDEEPDEEGPPRLPPVGSGLSSPFVLEFQDPSYVTAPRDYSLPLGRSQVSNLEAIEGRLDLDPVQVRFLLDNGMVGLAGLDWGYISFAEAYEAIQDGFQLPTFVTADSVLDAYHHIFEGILIKLEENDFIERAITMARGLMWASDAQIAGLLGDDQDLARMNVVYFGVALRILDPTALVPDHAEADIERIIEMIDQAQGKLTIPGFHQEEDFTQYKPRGHYTRSDELERYFKGMMWFGRITFQGKYDDETRRAALVAVALEGDEKAWKAYESMAQVIDFMVGPPDDLTPHEVMAEVEEVMGKVEGDLAPIFDDDLLDELQEALGELRPPRISSDIIYRGEENVWGMRVFGQRYVPDSYIFQNCVNDEVDRRYMPSCIDVFGVMGSQEAWDREDFEQFAPDLEDRMTDLREEFEGYPDEVWTSTLYFSWLHALKSLHESADVEQGPAFTQTRAWSAKELNTQAASWTQLTHDTLLYRKQSYSDLDSMPMPSDIIYVEPIPALYSRLGDMVSATEVGLKDLHMGGKAVFDKLDKFRSTLTVLERVAVVQMEGGSPSEEDVSFLKGYYGILGGLNKMGEGEEDTKTILVSDVHTDPNTGSVLQEAVGPVRLMLVVVPTEHGNLVAMGAVFEHYEFTQPMSDRLTDEQWKAMLDGGTTPEPAPWAQDFNP